MHSQKVVLCLRKWEFSHEVNPTQVSYTTRWHKIVWNSQKAEKKNPPQELPGWAADPQCFLWPGRVFLRSNVDLARSCDIHIRSFPSSTCVIIIIAISMMIIITMIERERPSVRQNIISGGGRRIGDQSSLRWRRLHIGGGAFWQGCLFLFLTMLISYSNTHTLVFVIGMAAIELMPQRMWTKEWPM